MFHVASITFQIHVLIQHFLLSSHLDSDPGVKEEGGKKSRRVIPTGTEPSSIR